MAGFHRFAEGAGDPLSYGDGRGLCFDFVAAQALAAHDELVAAETGCGIGRPQHRLEPPAGLDQQAVAGIVTEAVVDPFELIEVEEQHRHELTTSISARLCELDPVHGKGSVGQPGELIVDGEVGQENVGLFALRDVFDDHDGAGGDPGGCFSTEAVSCTQMGGPLLATYRFSS